MSFLYSLLLYRLKDHHGKSLYAIYAKDGVEFDCIFKSYSILEARMRYEEGLNSLIDNDFISVGDHIKDYSSTCLEKISFRIKEDTYYSLLSCVKDYYAN